MESLDKDIRDILEHGAVPVDKVIGFIEAHLTSSENTFQARMAALNKQREDAQKFKEAIDKIAAQSERQATEVQTDLQAEADRRAGKTAPTGGGAGDGA
jgi:hypothetical protein